MMKSSENGTRAFSCKYGLIVGRLSSAVTAHTDGWGQPSNYRLRRILTAGRYRCEMARIRYNSGLKIKTSGARVAPINGKGYSDGSEL